MAAAVIESVAFTSNAGTDNTYIAGNIVQVTVTFDQAVDVTGTPQITLNIGGTLVQADYESGSGTTDLVFSYTIQAGQNDADGISIGADALSLNGGTIKNGGDDADLTHSPVADDPSHLVDTSAPAAPSAPDLVAASDSGSSNSDNVTNDNTPTVTGTAEAGSTVTIYDTDGTTVLGTGIATGGTYSITLSTLSDGAHTLTAKATDTAGNTSVASAGLTVTIDTLAPTIAITTPIAGDGIVNAAEDNTVTVSGTTTGVEDGQTVTVTFSDGVHPNVIVQATVTSNAWTADPADISGLNNGSITVTASVSDLAGNLATPDMETIALDNIAPSFSSGTAASVVENTATTAVVYNAQADGDSGVTYSLGGADAGDFTINAATGEVKFVAVPNFEAPADAGGNNVYDIVITATDTAGNFTNKTVAITVLDSPNGTWRPDAATNDYNTGANWEGGSVPVVTAFFGQSDTTSISFSTTPTTVGGWTFNADADAYTFTLAAPQTLNFQTAGIVNHSGENQTIANAGTLNFNGASTAANNMGLGGTIISNTGFILFNNTSTAGGASINNNGLVQFNGSSSGGSATITTSSGALVQFLDSSNGGNATFINSGSATVNFSGTSAVNLTANSIAGGGSFILGTGKTLTIADGAGNTVSGIISGSGSGLTLTAGTLILTGDNTYDGTTTINNGATIQVGNGGITGQIDGAIVNDGTLKLNSSDSFDLDNAISGSGAFEQNGSGTVTFTNAKDYTGTTTINSGTLALSGAGSIAASGGLTLNGTATFNISGVSTGASVTQIDSTSGSSTVALGNKTLTLTGTGSTFAGAIQGTGGNLTVNTGSHTLSGNNSYTGVTTINNTATLFLSGTGDIAESSKVLVNSGGEFDIGGTTGASIVDLEGAGTVDLGSKTLTLTAASAATVFSGQIIGSGGLTLTGTSQETLTGNNSYTGVTTVGSGATLFLSGSGDIAESNGVTLNGTGSFNISTTTTGASVTRIDSTSGTSTVALGNKTLILTGTGSSFAGAISGTGGNLTVSGGQHTLSGDNSYTGVTTVGSGATLFLSGSGDIAESSKVLVASGGTFDIDDTTAGASIADLEGAGTVDLGDQTLTLTAASAATVFSGQIIGSGGLTLTGTSQETLTGNNSYTGVTTVGSGATLFLNGTGDIAESARVQVDGTFNIAGHDPDGTSVKRLDGAATGSVVLGNNTLAITGAVGDIFAGTISGSGGIDILAGTQIFTGDNTYLGETFIDEGAELELDASGSIAASSLVTADGTFDISGLSGAGTSIKSLAGGGAVDLGNKNLNLTQASGDFGGIISGAGGSLTVSGGTQVLSGNNTYTGTTSITGGTLALSGAGSIADSSGVAVASGATFNITATDGAGESIKALTGSGSVVLGAQELTLTNASGIFSGTISGVGGDLTILGGSQTLSGNNSYSGDTLIGDTASLLLTGSGSIAQSASVDVQGTFDISGTGSGASIKSLDGDGDVLLGARTLTITGPGGDFAGIISGTGGLTVSGGTQTLSGNNLYSGTTTISGGGTLSIGEAADIGGTSGVSLNNGTLAFSAGFTLGKDITLNAGGGTFNTGTNTNTLSGNIGGTGGLTKTGTGTLILSGGNDYGGGTTVTAGHLQGTTTSLQGNISTATSTSVIFDQGTGGTYAGNISGSGSLTKLGAGNVTLSGTNNYTGGTTVTAGTLTGTTTSLQGAITNNASVVFDQNTAGTYAGAMTGSGSLTKLGTGNVTLSGANNYSGGTTVSAGTLTGTTTSLQGAITNNASVVFDQNTAGTYTGAMTGSGSLTKLGTGNVTLSGANSYSGGTTVSAGTLTGTTTSLQGAITNNASVVFDQNTAGTYAGAMTGSGSLTKLGTGTLILSGNNDYLGTTTITAGTLQIGDGTTGSISNASNIVNNATLAFNLPGILPFSYAGTISGSGAVTVKAGSNIVLTGNNTYSGDTTIESGSTLTLGAGAPSGAISSSSDVANGGTFIVNRTGTFTYSGVISGSGQFQQNGTGTTVLTGANTYTGVTTIQAGTLQIGNGGTSGSIGSTSAVVNHSILAFNKSSDDSFNAAITGTGGLTKSGSGTLTLGGNNDYEGGTTINAGTLLVNGSIADSVMTTVNNGGTLGGDGSIGDVTVNDGGTLAPGASTGVLHTGDVTLVAGAKFQVEINGATAGTEYDQLDVTGSVALGNSTLDLVFDFSAAALGNEFTIIDNDGADAVSGTFAGLPDGAIIIESVSGQPNFQTGVVLKIDYQGGDGNDVVLSVVGKQYVGDNNPNTIAVADGDNFVFGLGGNDTLTAGNGVDTLYGGTGGDRLFSDAGSADKFAYLTVSESKPKAGQFDTVFGFERGLDKIDLSAIDPINGGANNKFKWINTKAFTGKAGELRWQKQGAHVLVQGDTNGDGRADFQIKIDHMTKMVVGDFIL